MYPLINNYLQQVESHLQESNEDVLLELRANIEDAFEEVQEGSDEPLTESKQSEILTRFGHPAIAAASFNKQQYLIGPSLFVHYLRSVKLSVFAVLCIHALLLVISRIINDDVSVSLFGFLFDAMDTAVYMIIVVTLVFASLEYSGKVQNWYANWDPLALLSRAKITANRQDATSNIITDAIVFVLWNNWFNNDRSFPILSELGITAGEIYSQIFWPVNLLLLVSLLFNCWQLMNNYWDKITISIDMLVNLATLLLVAYVLLTGEWFVSSENSEQIRYVLERANLTASIFFAFIGVVVLYDMFKHLKHFKTLRS